DLEEVELTRLVRDELDRAGPDVADRDAELDGRFAHRRAARRIERDRRRLLDDLLVTPLDRALALPQVHDLAVRIAEDLDLDVARPLDVLLEQQRVVAERRLRLAARALHRLRELARRAHDPHPLATAARARLDQQRILERLRI